ncbi:pentapeptide repeat-containing protein [Aerosakkonemataceae cyanobacterium BLCC-F154]|uniref:Pentapeptide repeat-containing protein n=1 Tax=Floridaenema fluviatile BLCC-F154 TaxID=3153640 RepID=A0ABV4YJP6_9CYAN
MNRNILLTLPWLSSLILGLGISAQEIDPVERLLNTKECSGCDLSGENLSNVDLGNANLSGADLSNANLRNSMLAGANLSGASLRGANLTLAVLVGANLNDADLSYANLTDTNLFRAKFAGNRGVDLTGATFKATIMPNGTVKNPVTNATSNPQPMLVPSQSSPAPLR